jgi:hypothetical protein
VYVCVCVCVFVCLHARMCVWLCVCVCAFSIVFFFFVNTILTDKKNLYARKETQPYKFIKFDSQYIYIPIISLTLTDSERTRDHNLKFKKGSTNTRQFQMFFSLTALLILGIIFLMPLLMLCHWMHLRTVLIKNLHTLSTPLILETKLINLKFVYILWVY